MRYAFYLLLAAFCFSTAAPAQKVITNPNGTKDTLVIVPTPIRKGYWGNGYDAAILSTAILKRTGLDNRFTTPRFSYVINLGFNYNYDFSKSFGIFTGAGIKNIGFIEKIGDSTVKRRVYTIGVPLAVKFGNLQTRNYGFIGGGVDVPFNYREKGFVKRNKKEKFSEWFSDRTPQEMPYVFAGVSFNPGIIVKVQYYPVNFLNEDFQETRTVGGISQISRPYAGYEANLLYISVGFDVHYKKLPKEVRDDEKPGGKPGMM